tara:strand:- start:589 stop:1890 length:1302 start_codon:yes stop_codon:yes gene_type:complete
MQPLISKIKKNKEIIGVIGLGYVGLPLAVEFAKNNIKVIGFDIDLKKIETLKKGDNYINDIDSKDFIKALDNKINFSSDFTKLKLCDGILICVPTPLDIFKKPNMSFIKNACTLIAKHMSQHTFICLESTTYPTTTEDFILPIIEGESNYKHGDDFWLAFSPERVDPGNKIFKTNNTPKIIGAISKEGLKIGKLIYSKCIEKLYEVSSPKVAEMVKILENTYRLVNISLINELALLAGKMDIDINEVIEAAKTKPFGFSPFYPGPGIGGHCIPLDPFYLEHIAKKYEFDLKMIETAGHINMRMPHYMFIKISSLLNKNSKSVNNSKILFLGVAYKPDISDERESPALKIIDKTISKGAKVSYHDPYINKILTPEGNKLESVSYKSNKLKEYDCVVITTGHSCFDKNLILNNSKLIVDLRNFLSTKKSNKIVKL